jgi:very-short-patch-repair endonuclease
VSRTAHSIKLISQADSTLEADFIRWLKDNGYRLPDAAQVTVPGTYAQPDFVYRRSNVRAAVFIDGPAHDAEAVAERDTAAASRLENKGWLVIRLRWNADWQSIMDENPTVFGEGRHHQRQQGNQGEQGSQGQQEEDRA